MSTSPYSIRRAGPRTVMRVLSARCRGRGCHEGKVKLGPRPYLDLEVGGLDCQGMLELQVVVRVINQLEALQQHAQHERGLMHGELAPDAGAPPVPNSLKALVGLARSASGLKWP